MANQGSIHVFLLTYPDQLFQDQPDLIIDLPPSNFRIRGDINPTSPHSANRALVAKLGTEEILLVACDDGDVIGYNTKSIQGAIDRKGLSEDHDASNSAVPAAFFHENVGRSAWGLAVHETARIIAVSANTHSITVFAFALANITSTEEDE